MFKVEFDNKSKKFRTINKGEKTFRNMMDSLVDMIFFVVTENQNDRYDRIFNKILKVIWAIIHNNLFDLRVTAFNKLFECLVKMIVVARSQNTKGLCKVMMHSLFKGLTDRLRLQFLYFKHNNPTRYFYSNALHRMIEDQTRSVLQGLVDKTVLLVEIQKDLSQSSSSKAIEEKEVEDLNETDLATEENGQEEKILQSEKGDKVESDHEEKENSVVTAENDNENENEPNSEVNKVAELKEEVNNSCSRRMKYFTNLSKKALAQLPAEKDRPNFSILRTKSELLNEQGHSAGIFGWCAVTRKAANYFCKEKRVPIHSIECKLKLAEEEERYVRLLKISQEIQQVEADFHQDYPLTFEDLASKCFESTFEKERLLFLNLLYSVIREPFVSLKSDPRFILFVKQNVFPNLMRIALNNEEEVLVVCLRIFVSLVENFRRFLRKEIGVFIEEVCLKMLDSANSKFVYKYYLLQVLTYLIEKNFLAFELFLNFDCREDSGKLCQRIIDLLVKTCQGRFLRNIYKDMVSTVEEGVLRKEASKAIVKLIRNCSMLLNKAKDNVLSEAPQDLCQVLDKKKKINEAIDKFNAGKKAGLRMLRELSVVDDTAESLAKFLREDTRVAQSQIGEVFGGDDEFSLKVLDCFLESLSFKDMDILDALKYFLKLFELPGEGQKIERILDAFSKSVAEANPEMYTLDASFQLSFLLMMIHTDTYNPSVIDKMSISTFLSVGKNIINHGSPVPPEILTKYFHSVRAEPLAIHQSERRKKDIQNTLSRTFREKEQLFRTESLKFINTFWEKVKFREIIEDYRLVKSYSVLKLFLYNIWTSLQAFFSTSIAGTDDIETLRDLVDATMSMIKLCDVFEMQTERDSFLTILVQFSNLEKTYGRPFTEKNLLFIQSVLDIATKEGNHLRSGWKLVLNCVISLNSHHQRSESLTPSPNVQFTVKEQNALFIKRNFSLDSLKKLFADSSKLSEESLLFFLEGLSRLAVKDLEKFEENRFAYTIEQIMNVFHYNQYRNPLAWLRIWKVINQLFDDIVSQTNDKNIALVLLSSNCLKNLVSLSFSNENLINNNYQSNILELYVTILSNNNLRPDYLNFSLMTLMDLLRKSGKNLSTGCKELIAILNLAEELVFRYINLPNVPKWNTLEKNSNVVEEEVENSNTGFDQVGIDGNPEKEAKNQSTDTLRLSSSEIQKKYLDITGTVYLEVLQDILQILKFIFSNFQDILPFLKDHLSGLLNVIINLSKKTNLEIVFTALEHQEHMFNLFWQISESDNQKLEIEESPSTPNLKKKDLENELQVSDSQELDTTLDTTEKSESQIVEKISVYDILSELKKSPKHIFFHNENLYFQQFIHPSLKSLVILSKWHSQEDFKNAVNRLFEFLHKIEQYLFKDSWKLLFEEVFHPLLLQTVAQLNPHPQNKYLQDFREIVLFALKNMYSFCLHNEELPLELIEMNFEVLLKICRKFKNNKFFLEIVILSLSQNITETSKLVDSIWIDDIWAVLIRFLSSLFHDHIPTQLIENPLFQFIQDFKHSLKNKHASEMRTPVKKQAQKVSDSFELINKENLNATKIKFHIDFDDTNLPSLEIDCKHAETQCRFVLNLMKLIEQVFKNTLLVESSSLALIDLAQDSKTLALAFNDNVLYRFVFWKKGYMYNRDCLPSLHSFEISVLRARFFYLKRLYGSENADMIGFIIETYKDFSSICGELKKTVMAYKGKPTLLFLNQEDDREFELHSLIDTQTRTLFLFDFVNEYIGGFLNKNETIVFQNENQNQELVDTLIDYLGTGPSMFHSNFLKCIECLGCNKCFVKTAKQRRLVNIAPKLKSLIKQIINLEFETVKIHDESLNATPLHV